MSSNNSDVVADKLENIPAISHINYWCPLACLVEEQEEEEGNQPRVDHLLSITADTSKMTEWKRKTANRNGILDMGCVIGHGIGGTNFPDIMA